MSKTDALILADKILKKGIIKDLEERHNINSEIINKHSEFFDTYVNLKFELLLYNSTIPYEELEHYKNLKDLEAKFFLELIKILNEEENINKT